MAYDDARRLTRITDGLNNYIEYVLDTEGNVEHEEKAVVVYFYRQLDGLRVMNYGSSITITIGDSFIPSVPGFQDKSCRSGRTDDRYKVYTGILD